VLLEGDVSHPVAEGEGQWCIATTQQPGVRIQRCSRWNPHGDGSEIWGSFSRDGSIPDSDNDRRSGSDDPASAALALQCRLEPGQSLEIPLVISWDLPVTAFATGSRALRRYTDFFDASGTNAAALAAEALRDWRHWRDQIQAWQQSTPSQEEVEDTLEGYACLAQMPVVMH
jgi:non-lysosomal glucosylceramidase